MATARDPITCHVLDTTTGRPGAGIRVRLTSLATTSLVFEAITNADGRVANWSNSQGAGGEEGVLVQEKGGVAGTLQWLITSNAAIEASGSTPAGTSLWKLEFDTGSYYGLGNVFFPQVDLTFLVKAGEHFHVPLLLGPYSFTTYRGS